MELIHIMGAVTFTLLLITAFLGLNLWKLHLPGLRSWHHFLAAGLTIISATAHLLLVNLMD